jgi:hypothetical protein
MAKIAYTEQRFYNNSRWLIDEINAILEHYVQLGFGSMTLRQLFYQLVKSNKITNTKKSYNNLGTLLGTARLAGYIDWDHLEDRARQVRGVRTFDTPLQVLRDGYLTYRIDMWENQAVRPEIWIEKDALSGPFESICGKLNVNLLACKGYLSLSEAHEAALRFRRIQNEQEQTPIIFHFGDHDSSGLDMTRDIRAKFDLFIGGADVRRIALTMDQIKQFDLPPQYAKMTDPRYEAYRAQHGDQSWELDALDPQTLNDLVEEAVKGVRDEDKWNESLEREEQETNALRSVHKHWPKVVKYCNKLNQPPKPRKKRKKGKKKRAVKRKVATKKSRSQSTRRKHLRSSN